MDLLWKKEPDNPELYRVIFENMSETPVQFSASKFNAKDNEISTQCRRDGNMKFKTGEWLEAMSAYNQSLCYAEIGSENVSLAYANRSACFLHLEMFEKCLVDIEMAKQANYPTKQMSKLDERRDDCLSLMNAREDLKCEALSYDADERFQGMANVLEIRRDKKFGRHIIAKRDIPAGKTVLAEEAFMARLLNMRYNSCAVCMKISMNFVACPQCTMTLFCSSDCVTGNDMHKTDCAELPQNMESGPLEYYVGTMTYIISLFPNAKRLIEFVENAIKGKDEKGKASDSLNGVKSKFRALLQLSRNDRPTQEKSNERLHEAHKIFNILLSRKSIKQLFENEQHKRFLMHLALQLNCVMINNSFDAGKGIELSIYIISAYFNHSCAPNVLGINTHKSVRYCRTVRPIKAGEQLFISYLGDLTAEPGQNSIREIDSDHRQTMLYENYGFQCMCERCKPSMKSWQISSHEIRSSRFFQWFYTKCDSFMNDEVGSKQEKAVLLEKKMVEFLNRFGVLV